MPDGLRATTATVWVRVAATVAAYVVAGVVAGVVWEQWWSAPVGLTYGGEWFLEPAGPDFSFQGAALYVLIALPLGVVLAVLSSIRPGHEVATVITVLVAAAIGGAVMYAVGHAIGPPDPQALAAARPDFTPLPGDLVLGGSTPGERPFASTALIAMPAGAMAGLVGVYLLGRKRIGEPSHG
ncbi:MAG: hypothetical protein LH477_02560 [Nocardioides sp.]|nr:hypothetical protein [Nocardioides sp.]